MTWITRFYFGIQAITPTSFDLNSIRLFVCYSCHDLNDVRFNCQTGLDHLNTRLVSYSDLLIQKRSNLCTSFSFERMGLKPVNTKNYTTDLSGQLVDTVCPNFKRRRFFVENKIVFNDRHAFIDVRNFSVQNRKSVRRFDVRIQRVFDASRHPAVKFWRFYVQSRNCLDLVGICDRRLIDKLMPECVISVD